MDVEVAGEDAGHRHRPGPQWNVWGAAAKWTVDLLEGGDGSPARTAPAGGVDEEVEQHLVAVGGAGEQEAAAGQAGEPGLEQYVISNFF